MTTPTPLPAWSPRLEAFRYEVQPYSSPIEESSHDGLATRRYLPLAGPARFSSLEDAKTYADQWWTDAVLIFIDRYSASAGWVPYRVATREDGEWS